MVPACIFSPNNMGISSSFLTEQFSNTKPRLSRFCLGNSPAWWNNNVGYAFSDINFCTDKYRYRPANPGYKVDELVHQLRATKAALLIVHPAFSNIAKSAARDAGMPEDRIIFIEPPPRGTVAQHITLDELVDFGLNNPANYTEQKFKPGEGKNTLAFLSFSSGTTGKLLKLYVQ